MLDQKENMTPSESPASSNAHSIGNGGLKLPLELFHAQRIVRFGENENDIFMLKDGDTARAMLVEKVKADPTSPDKWLELLNAPPSYEAKLFSKVRLVRRATHMIPKEKCRHMKSYVEIWIQWAQLKDDEKGARDTFKYMKSERIGERERLFYEHYAAFEFKNGNQLEADEILSLGVRNGVLTAGEKDSVYERLVKGEMPRLASGRSTSSTMSSLLQTPREQRTNVARSYQTPGGSSTATSAGGSTMTPQATLSASSTGFNTSRKTALMTTPSTSARLQTNAMSSSRIGTPSSRFFNLGGPPLRVKASNSPDAIKEEDGKDSLLDDDDDDFGMKDEPVKVKSEPLSPVRENGGSLSSQPPSQSRSIGGVGEASTTKKAAADLSYIRNWTPKPIPSMSSSSRAPSFDHNNADLYPSPKRHKFGGGVENADIGASGPQIRLDPHSPASVGSVSSTSSPRSSVDGSVPRDPFSKLTSKVVVNGKTYIKLEQIGSGGSSKVYRMLGPDLKIYALKKIKLKRLDPKSVEQYTNEIQLLQRLQGNPFIISLIAAEQDMSERVIHVLMEHGEIDLGERLRELKDGLDENFLRVLWTQMLQAVHAIHSERIIHGDLKPANFLFVNGALKLIDFGIAKAISNDTTNIERDSQVGTVNFMSPEAIQGNTGPGGQRNPQGKMKVGRASDIWSLGCILYQIVYGKPPFADLGSIIEKFRCIIDPNYAIPFPSLVNQDLEDVIRKCLQRDHRARPTIDGLNGLLEHPFLKNSSANSSTGLRVTLENGEAILGQMGDLLRTQGVEKSRVATFLSIGKEGLRGGNRSDSGERHAPNIYQPARGAYKYDTEERRTDI